MRWNRVFEREKLMLSVAIVEDDRKYSKLLEGYLERYSAENDVKFKVDVFDDGLKFIMGYDGDGGYNIVFMDVEMPRLDGIKTSRKLRATDKNVSLIFVTNMAKYAVSGYEVDALDFMVKPVDYFNFSLKLEKAVRIQQAFERRYTCRSGRRLYETQDFGHTVCRKQLAFRHIPHGNRANKEPRFDEGYGKEA